MTNRNLAIDWIKGWMIIFVVLLHTWAFHEFHFYLAVDVFFFISGYYLMLSHTRRPTTTVQYTWKRIKTIALPFFICLLFRCCLNWEPFLSPGSYDAAVEKWSELLYTLSFLEEFGVYLSPEQILIGSWYFSVLIIASFFLYGLLEFNEKLATRVLFPAIVLFGFNAMLVHSELFSYWGRVYMLGSQFVRGYTEMAAGALICSIYQENKTSFEKRSVFINIMGIVSFVLFMATMFSSSYLDKFLIVTVPWILLAAVIDGSWLSKALERLRGGLISRIGQFTLYILCAHYPAIILGNWCNEHFFNSSLQGFEHAFFDVLFVIPATYLLYIICKWIRGRKVLVA